MTALNWQVYDTFARDVGTGVIDLDTDTFHMALFLVTSNASDIGSSSILSELTNEHAESNGYIQGGCPLSSVTFARQSGGPYSMFDAANLDFNADGGNLVFRRGVIYSLTGTGSPLVAQTLFDDTPDDITLTDGNVFTCCFSASGILSFVASSLA
jgi:hypothetical protein